MLHILYKLSSSQVIRNLQIAHIELRAEDDPEVLPYTHQRQIDVVVCDQGAYCGVQAVRKYLNALMQIPLELLSAHNILPLDNAEALTVLHIADAAECE